MEFARAPYNRLTDGFATVTEAAGGTAIDLDLSAEFVANRNRIDMGSLKTGTVQRLFLGTASLRAI
jgi:hypothetical protein